MTTGTVDRPGISDRTDTVHAPVTGAFADALVGYSMCFTCEWTYGCDNEVEWFADQHGCETAHLCSTHMGVASLRFAENMERWGCISCIFCKKKFTTWDTWVQARPI